MGPTEKIKENAGRYAADRVVNGMTLGLGTGSTVYWLIQELGQRIQQGLNIKAVPTSVQTAELAEQAGITLSDLDSINQLPLAIDGADEIDPQGRLLKGGGGALLQEKIVAAASARLIIIADHSKLVTNLGKFPLPVEVIPFGYKQVRQKILNSGFCGEVNLRVKNGKTFVSDHGHYILDCVCDPILDPEAINTFLQQIPGIVENGLFIGMADEAIIGYEDGTIQLLSY